MASNGRREKKISLQEREVQRYYQPWVDAQGSSLNVADHVDSIARDELHGTGYRPRASRDKALTAFAQLAALRLNVKRAMVSLIDPTKQIILAEATQNLTIARGDENHGPNDLWLGSAILNRADAICEHCFFNTCTATDPNGQTFTCKGLIVNDCRLDDRFKDRPYVVDGGVLFYAGVPITSRSGHMIGAYAVSDDKPRDGLDVAELRFMQSISTAVMEHFEWARDRVDRFKGERIVRGMAAFIEGSSSMSGNPDKDDADEDANSASEQTDKAASRSFARPAFPKRRSATRIRTKEQAAAKSDSLSSMFERAAVIMRESTLADGAVIFGTATGSIHRSRDMTTTSTQSIQDAMGGSTPDGSLSPGSESAHQDTTSDSDTSPYSRPCKILAFSLRDEQARADIEQGSALTLGTLEKYHSLYPHGHTFHFTQEGNGLSSDDDSASEADTRPVRRKGSMDHKELLKKIPGAKSVMFLPLYDYLEERLVAGCFLWTSVAGRMMNLDDDLSYLTAFGNSIMSEVNRMNAQKNEAAKTTFIASMSHELRSPLHGILGATEFLKDTAADSYQSGLITSIMTCGKTLLDTLNHVLDYSKINKLGRAQMRKNAKQNKLVNLPSDSSLESINMTAEVDLGVLVEEVVEAVTAGHAFKTLHGSTAPAGADLFAAMADPSTKSEASESLVASNADSVMVLLDISPCQSWMVRTQPGALRRIIMNLIGNSLKYTSSGFVAVSLRAQQAFNSPKIDALIRVVDSGRGMSEDFQQNRLFVPFSQEDTFQPGTGLGLSIVKQIADSLSASVHVKSEQNVGTEVEVQLSLTAAGDDGIRGIDDGITAIRNETRGLQLALLDPSGSTKPRPPNRPVMRLEETLGEMCETWFEMGVIRTTQIERSDSDFFLYSEPPSVEQLLERFKNVRVKSPSGREVPLMLVCLNAEEAIKVSRNQVQALNEIGKIVEVIPQPCGPRKLAKVLSHCLSRLGELEGKPARSAADRLLRPRQRLSNGAATPKAQTTLRHVQDRQNARESSAGNDSSHTPMSSAVAFPSPPPLDPETPPLKAEMPYVPKQATNESSTSSIHVLLVDDNRINLQLLVMFMKKHQYSFEEAENGQEAVDRYKAASLPGPNSRSPGKRFDYVLMDISMPVMNGIEATKHIRDFEQENGLKKTTVIALTGLASAQAQREAQHAGVDIFLPKPVRFAELKKLLVPP